MHWEEKEETEIHIEIIQETTRHNKGMVYIARVEIFLPHINLRVDKQGETIESATKQAYQDIKRQIRRYKTGRQSRIRRGARFIKKLIFRK